MRVQGQPAFVLRTQNYLESSLLVDIYCRDHGRLKLVVKGAKSGRSAKSGKLQLFSELSLSWQGKSELKTLTDIESGAPILARPDRLVSGMYLNELLFFLLTELDPHPEVYQIYKQTLAALEQQETLEPALRHFEFGLLQELGYGVDFSEDIDGQALSAGHLYRYYPDSGFARVDPSSSGAIPGAAIVELVTQGLQTNLALRAAKLLCRAHIDLLLNGKELQSRKWAQMAAKRR